MVRSRLAWSRVMLGVVALVAVVAMHGSAADAHTCDAPHSTAHRSTGTTTSPHEGVGHHSHHEEPARGSAGEAPSGHCSAMACSAVVDATTVPAPAPSDEAAVLRPPPCEALASTSHTPEPPVPRGLLHA